MLPIVFSLLMQGTLSPSPSPTKTFNACNGHTRVCGTWRRKYPLSSFTILRCLFSPCSHQLHPSLPDKASAAAQYYLSHARYSPLRSRNNRGVKVAFGSGAPRWPASKPPQVLPKHEPKQEAFRPQPFMTKPLFGGHPPAVGRRGADQSVLKKDLLPSYQDVRGRGWKSSVLCRPSVPSVVSGAAYHSALASTQRANIHGRTDWTSK